MNNPFFQRASEKQKETREQETANQPWIEKWRPTKLDDIVGHEETLHQMRGMIETGSMPNLLLSGPPGCGKTTSVHVLARTLLGDRYKDAVLELNASDERGIDVVRNKIKMFAQKKVTLPAGRCKIIILDEADAMTKGAQQAMRRTMEIYSATTRFALACNLSDKIIEPIQSRCAIVRFSRLSDKQVLERLVYVCEQEKVPHDARGLEAIVFCAEGDMRNALNSLQACHSGFQMVNQENVFRVCDTPHPEVIGAILQHCLNGELDDACDRLLKLRKSGYSPQDLIKTIFQVCKRFDDKEMSEYVKLEFLKIIGFFHVRISEGCASDVQLCGMVARLCGCSLEAKSGKSWSTPQKTLMEIRKEGGSIGVSGSEFQ
ncbi:unnamed protein product [Bathycoccus prasinos]|jgi:replication factor C subunit 2/4|mmetsp:Transcript_1554/g.5649  ORF Transcript_1554/g.5649 Transcript_1554/m.5649 type:complete len:374 (+) Transcript_1554:64-1185(+)